MYYDAAKGKLHAESFQFAVGPVEMAKATVPYGVPVPPNGAGWFMVDWKDEKVLWARVISFLHQERQQQIATEDPRLSQQHGR